MRSLVFTKTQTVTLNESQMPSHRHQSDGWVAKDYGQNMTGRYAMMNDGQGNVASGDVSVTTYTGGGQSHSNLQPYQTVYVWRRTK